LGSKLVDLRRISTPGREIVARSFRGGLPLAIADRPLFSDAEPAENFSEDLFGIRRSGDPADGVEGGSELDRRQLQRLAGLEEDDGCAKGGCR